MLEIRGLNVWYGTSQVLFDLGLTVGRGEIVALVGRNGAGKTTTLRSIMGMGGVRRTGSIRVGGVETIGMPGHEIARLGVGLAPEGRRVFGSLTVEENLRVAAGSTERLGSNGARKARKHGSEGERWSLERIFDVFPLLARVRGSKGAWLSGGEQQALAIARVLVAGPGLLLLDEPSEGLAPGVVEALIEQLRLVRRTGIGALLAEQNTGLVGELASRVCRLELGVGTQLVGT